MYLEIKQHISKYILYFLNGHYFQLNGNENAMYYNLCNVVKAMFKGIFFFFGLNLSIR